MDIPDEGQEQINKRKAMQAVMRDSTLSPQERQQKMRDIISGKIPAASVPSQPPAATPPAPEPSPPAPAAAPAKEYKMDMPDESTSQVNKRKMIQEVMRDSSLSSQEKQKKIQQIMAGKIPASANSAAANEPSPPPQQQSAPPPAPAKEYKMDIEDESNAQINKRKLIQEVMRDSSLSSQERQKKIQQIMTGKMVQSSPPGSDAQPPPPQASSDSGLTDEQKNLKQAMLDQRRQERQNQDGSQQPTPPRRPPDAISNGIDPGQQKEQQDRRSQARSIRIQGRQPSVASQPGAQARGISTGHSEAQNVKQTMLNQVHSGRGQQHRQQQEQQKQYGTSPRAQRPPNQPNMPGMGGMPPPNQNYAQQPQPMMGMPPAAAAGYPPAAQQAYGQPNMHGKGMPPPSQNYAQLPPQQQQMHHQPPPNANIEMSQILHNKEANFAQQRAAASEMQQLERDLAVKSTDIPTDSDLPNQPPASNDHSVVEPQSRSLPPIGGGDVQPREEGPPTETSPVVDSSTPTGGAVENGGIEAFVADTGVEALKVDTVMSEREEEEVDNLKRRRLLCRIGGILCLSSIAIIVAVVVVFAGGSGSGGGGDAADPTESPTSAPTASPTLQLLGDFRGVLEGFYDDKALFETAFSSTTSPQYRAAAWATQESTATFDANHPRLLSRYALAAFYFATGGDNWLECGRGSTVCAVGEWLDDGNECDWFAIDCDDDNVVTRLFFPPSDGLGNNLVGTLPYELALLSGLNFILIELNEKLTGTIPTSWSPRMSSLTYLSLHDNAISGTFPSLIVADNPFLKTIDFGFNKFKGSLSGLGVVSQSLESLLLVANEFTGTIPSGINQLEALVTLELHDNDLSGSIPPELYDLTNLRLLHLYNNPKMNGKLSEDIIQWSEMQNLRLENTGIGGELPVNLFNVTELQFLVLSNAQFSGTIPEEIYQMTSLREARFDNNKFSGPIPDTLPLLVPVGNSVLNGLRLHGNDIVGTIPQIVCDAIGTARLDLKELTADCATDPPEVECSCCTCF